MIPECSLFKSGLTFYEIRLFSTTKEKRIEELG